ncbi:hypothetical protein COS75_00035 [Candidatus Pacearchaeota archaeon CG06_land_8_20_14_3_00_35_12]|nr:MAG: hypothetical protein COS75_00035 [Candidatus Pacearchaeota archaeon CG06_land_8_20_14_3_00_35_12]
MLGKIYSKTGSNEEAVKYLWAIDNKARIDAVLFNLPYREIKYTICTSTQAGCEQDCKFCATAGKKFYKNLDQDEIIGQAQSIVEDNPFMKKTPWEIAFMATGEPFLNYENVTSAINRVSKLYSSFRQVNLSTIGITDKIYRFADEDFKDLTMKLQISLNHPENKKRDRIMPSKAKGSIEELLEAGKYYSQKRNRKVSLNYLLLKGVNDSDEAISKLIQLIQPFKDFFYIKLSRMNATNSPFCSPKDPEFEKISKKITEEGIDCKIFFGTGNTIAGNCGQLYLEKY